MGRRKSFQVDLVCRNQEWTLRSYCSAEIFLFAKGPCGAEQPLRDGLPTPKMEAMLICSTGTWERCCDKWHTGRSGRRSGCCHSALSEAESENDASQALLYQAQATQRPTGTGARQRAKTFRMTVTSKDERNRESSAATP